MACQCSVALVGNFLIPYSFFFEKGLSPTPSPTYQAGLKRADTYWRGCGPLEKRESTKTPAH